MFVGQGLSRSVGFDCYGYYVLAISKAKNGKLIVGIAGASTRFAKDWTDGDQECALDPKAEVCYWLTTYGKHWYYCDENGKSVILSTRLSLAGMVVTRIVIPAADQKMKLISEKLQLIISISCIFCCFSAASELSGSSDKRF